MTGSLLRSGALRLNSELGANFPGSTRTLLLFIFEYVYSAWVLCHTHRHVEVR